MPSEPRNFDNFKNLANALGLKVPTSEEREMYEGLKGLNTLMKMLPDANDRCDVPATIFIPRPNDTEQQT